MNSGILLLAILFPALLLGQDPQQGTERLRPSYILGPGDQILIRALEADEINDKPFRIDGDGFLNLPLIGRIRAGGLAVEQLEAELAKALKTYIRNPQVIVTVVQFRSEPVFFVGAFQRPGIYPLQGRRTLVEMLTSIGGLLPNASRRLKLTRREEFGRIPLPNAKEDAEQKVTVAEISLGSLRQNVNPAEDVVLQPFDVIAVERAEMVYINGEVGKVGGFELAERESISIIQIITLAGGLTQDAAPDKARVLRPVMNSSKRAEIPLDLNRILKGDANDFPLLPNDVLYVPRSSKRVFWSRVAWSLPLVSTLLYVVLR